MTFQLVDINSAQSLPPKTSVVIGAVLRNADGEYFASDGTQCWSGSGVPSSLLGGRVWICDVEFKESIDWAAAIPGRQIRAGTWMRSPLRAMMEEWGLTVETEANAKVVAKLLNRAFSMSNEIVAAQLDPKARDWTVNIGSSPSLATALSEALLGDAKTEVPPNLQEANRNGYKLGAMLFGRRGGSPDTMWRFQAPRLSHARKVMSSPVPVGEWKMVQLNGMDIEAFRSKLAEVKLPALIRIDAHNGSQKLPATMRTWFSSTDGGARFWLTGEELLALTQVDGLVIEAAYLADGAASTGSYERCLMGLRTLNGQAVEAQNLSLPALSWSAGLLAENVLAASFRRPNKDRPGFAPTFYSAQDRILTEGRARIMAEAGVSVVSYYLGCVVAQVGRDAESVLTAADAAWRAGLLLPAAFVELGKSLGIKLAGKPEDWGGDPEDLLLARLIASGRTDIRWQLDQVLDLKPELRNAAFIEILKKLMGKR